MQHKTTFSFITPTFNSEKTAKQALLSVFAQSYQNWRMIVIDDCSTDNTQQLVKNLFDAFGCKDKLVYVSNSSKKWEIENTLIGLSHCDKNDVVCRLDLDDYLLDNSVLEQLNMIYSISPDVHAVWTSHRWFSEQTGLTNTNISKELPPYADPYLHPWVSSHFKTWKKHISDLVSDANYRGQDGSYFKRIGDQAFYLPVLKLAKIRIHIPIVSYAYRCDQNYEVFHTDDAKFQADEAKYLRHRGFIK